MALTKTINLKTNLGTESLIESAHIRVDSLLVPRKNGNGERVVEAVVTIATDADSAPLERRGYFFNADLNGLNFISQAYTHLKTLPEFDGAQDC